MSQVKTGVVRAYNSQMKKGLIKCDDGSSDIPIYKWQLDKFSMESLKTGDSVRIEIEKVGNSHTILAIEYLE